MHVHAGVYVSCVLINKWNTNTQISMLNHIDTFRWKPYYIFINAVLYGWLTSLILLPPTAFLKIESSFTVFCVKDKAWHVEILSVIVGKCLHWHRRCILLPNKLITSKLRGAGVWIRDAEGNWNVHADKSVL